MRGHVQFVGLSSVHPGQMVTEINFKFYTGLKGIEIILAPSATIILDKLDKTVKIDIFIKVISRDIHPVTSSPSKLCYVLIAQCDVGWQLNVIQPTTFFSGKRQFLYDIPSWSSAS